MKTIILIGDGMGDYPCPELDDRTPLQAAEIPCIRRLAAAGEIVSIQTIPEGMSSGSDVANLGLLGYDQRANYTGRAPIEAAGARIPMTENDVAYRCNVVTVEDGRMKDYSAGHITTPESRALIADLDEAAGSPDCRFHGGVSYRHLLIWKNGPVNVQTHAPHDITDLDIEPYLPAGERAEEIRSLMARSIPLFASHEVNRRRIGEQHDPASQIWLWGQGRALQLKTFCELYGLEGGMVTAVDLLKGLGVLAGLETPDIEGATGFIDTNYEGKVQAALEILSRKDFMYLHIEAPDECGHVGDAALKTKAITDFDHRVVEPVWQELERRGEPYRLVLTMDHRTPVSLKKHSVEPVPALVVEGPTGPLDREAPFDETLVEERPAVASHQFVRELLKGG